MREIAFSLAFLLVAGAPAAADSINVDVTPQAEAPIALTGCTLQKQMVPLARGVSVEGFRTGVTFEDRSPQPVQMVIFLFTMRDGSGGLLDTHTFKSTGSYAPGVTIDNIHWFVVDSWPTLGTMDCSVQHVLFANGLTWDAPSV